MPKITRRRPIGPRLLSARCWRVVAVHQAVDDAVEIGPWRQRVAIVSYDEGCTRIELLVLLLPPSELGANQIPRQLEQLHAIQRRQLRGRKVGFELPAQFGILQDGCVRRHLEHTSATQLSDAIDDAGVTFRAPVQRRVHHAAAESHETVRPALRFLNLSGDNTAQKSLLRGEAADGFAYRRHGIGARGLRYAARQTDKQTQLAVEADI